MILAGLSIQLLKVRSRISISLCLYLCPSGPINLQKTIFEKNGFDICFISFFKRELNPKTENLKPPALQFSENSNNIEQSFDEPGIYKSYITNSFIRMQGIALFTKMISFTDCI